MNIFGRKACCFFCGSVLMFVSLGCGSKSIQTKIYKSRAYFVVKYIYGYDSWVGEPGYWFQERTLVTKEQVLPLAGSVFNYLTKFYCDDYAKLVAYAKERQKSKGIDVYQFADSSYYKDDTSDSLYIVIAVSGDFIDLKKRLCNKDKGALRISNKKPCKFGPKSNDYYPLVIPLVYYTSEGLPLDSVRQILGVANLRRVSKDTLRFFECK